MDTQPTGCKTSAYLAPMVIVLILLVAILIFGIWYYLAQLKPRLDVLVADKISGSVGFKDSTGTQLLLQPVTPAQVQATGQSSRISLVNIPARSDLDFSLWTQPIPGNVKQQSQVVINNPKGSNTIPLTFTG